MSKDISREPAFCPICSKSMARGVNWYDIGETRMIVWYCVNAECDHGTKNRSKRSSPRISGSHCG